MTLPTNSQQKSNISAERCIEILSPNYLFVIQKQTRIFSFYVSTMSEFDHTVCELLLALQCIVLIVFMSVSFRY